LDIPTMLEIRRLERAEMGSPAQPRRAWGLRQRLVLLGTAATVIAVFLAAGLYLKRPVLPAPDPQQAEKAAQDLTLSQSFAAWEALHTGLNTGPQQLKEEYTKRVAVYHLWLFVTAAIGGLGVLCAAGSLLVPKPDNRRRPPPG
jgi:hypothetical protein